MDITKKSERETPKIELLPGFIEVRHVKCGRCNCHCATTKGHGPYHYWVYKKGKRRFKRYVKKTDLPRLVASINERRKQIKEKSRTNQESRLQLRTLKARLKEIDMEIKEISRLMETEL